MVLKAWELVYILEIVNREKKCVPGTSGLVFAVGIEPLVSRFAQQGCSIHATDFPMETEADPSTSDNPWVSGLPTRLNRG